MELETYERGPELFMDKNGNHVDLVVEGGLFQLGWIKVGGVIGKSPRLTVKLPKNYSQNLKLDGSSGILKLRNLTLNDVHFSTTSGHVDGSGLTVRRIGGNSTSGNIRLKLNDQSPDLTLETTTASGGRDIDFAIKGSERGNRFSGRIGKGTNQVRLKTSSGNIAIAP
ncbi:DUF4097 family beta strand repeat-containing protein [Kroppenstedtia guangzhouensis]|uniref:DUF4097 family beta strand repeat-containing protein n=1 Tax=Kroppenstedtia guangzhouensis TaxID=1274356 RepID=UPI001E321965|nr:DUF4097 family beta strand repeat-containing protein [Kroppenstedtia guangzhouensis]